MNDVLKAKTLIDKDRKDRLKKCVDEISDLLKRYNCEIDATPEIRPDGTIGAKVLFVAK